MDYADGSSFYIPAVYDSGAEGAYSEAPDEFADLPLAFACPNPYWTSVDLTSILFTPAAGTSAFLDDFITLPVESSNIIGDVAVVNTGDVASPISWLVTGPAATFGVTADSGSFAFNGALAEGEVVKITRAATGWSVTGADGSNRYDLLDGVPVFPTAAPGSTDIVLAATGVGVATSVLLSFPRMREIVY